jgi:peptide/nickel transport system ATP-binding protein
VSAVREKKAPTEVALAVDDVTVEYGSGHRKLQAVAGVTFQLGRGETLGVVGESGCGKSSLGRAILQLHPPATGTVNYDGVELTTLKGKDLQAIRSRMQVVLQDPVSALNPRRKIIDVVSEGLLIHGMKKREARAVAAAALREVGMDPDVIGGRKPHEFSGGQCQRIAIARAMALQPGLLICDEPVASLDVSIQAQVLTLLIAMKESRGLSMIFISHDLSVVMNLCNRVAVMYLGKIVELGSTDEIYQRPRHPYTRILLDSVPVPDPTHVDTTPGIKGEIPSPKNPPSGCRFRTRCPLAQPICAEVEPELVAQPGGGSVACHFPLVDGKLPIAESAAA